MAVTVTPGEFKFVDFDGSVIAQIAESVMADLGIDADLEIEVNETTPLGHTRVDSLDPLRIYAESGAFEDVCRVRQLGETVTRDVLGRLLIRVADRADAGFGAPPVDADLDLAHAAAWDSYSMGRLAHRGYTSQLPRRRYQFLLRHGFSDVAEQAFRTLWDADGLAWADITALSDHARVAAA